MNNEIILANVAPDETPAQPNHNDNSNHAHTGKIGRLGDARAKAIEAAPWSHAEKIEGVGIHMFGPLWEPRPVPVSENNQAKSTPVKVSPA